MLARRIVAVSPDRGFGQRLEAALAGVAGAVAVDVHPTVDAVEAADAAGAAAPPPALCVIHLPGELARAPRELWARLPGTCPVIAVSPRAGLAAALELMQSSDRVAAVMIAEELDPRRLSAVAARLLADDLFGLEHVMAPGAQIHAASVGDYQEKLGCMAQIAALVEQAGAPRLHRASIEQCVDEMLMNALYDAPRGARGEPLFAGVPARDRIAMRTAQRVAVQYACDGEQLAVGVRDAFGALERRTVLRFLHKGLHAAQQVDRRAGGAGLGLYLMANAATAVQFHVLPGIATEAICVFDLRAPRLALERLAFLVQLDARGQRATGPARRLRAGPRRRGRILAAALAALAVLAGALALARVRGGAPAAEQAREAPPAPPVAAVELDSEPTGAAVEIDGAPMGSTPLTVTSLAPGATVSIVFRRIGYRAETARLQVPALGEATRLVQPLARSDDFVRVRFVSSPPGAEVTRTGEPPGIDRTYTPADVFVEADQLQRFTLTMPRHVPLVIEPFTPARGARGLEKGGALAPGAILRVEAARGGTLTISGAPHCHELAPPLACTLAPGTYRVAYLRPDGTRVTRTVTMTTQDELVTID